MSSDTVGYFVPAGAGESEYDEKRSRFLGHVRPVSTEEEARAFIAEMKKTYYDARHNCWCYIINGGAERYSDDSEPQGTAGIPMLEVFHREGVRGVVCVVTRYFGGVLLGAGGLLRAYTRAAKEALDAAGTAAVANWTAVEVTCGYSVLERIKNEAAALGGITESIDYGAGITIRMALPEKAAADFAVRAADITAGSAVCRTAGTVERAVRIEKEK
jgi:uncharacterized YigZ family protein